MTVLQDWISAIEGWVPMLADSLWVFPALFLFATIDGFFPPIPSESVVIALASLSVSQGAPNIVLVVLAAALGAFAGDQIAYAIGSRVDVHRLRVFRTVRGRKALAWAEHALAHRGSSFILAARYIPIGRVAVNMTAGALGYPRKRFVGLTGLAAVTWAVYGSAVGAGAGLWLEDHPLIAVVAGVVVGTLVGVGIDWVLRRWTGIDRTPVVVATAAATTAAAAPAGRSAATAATPARAAAAPAATAPPTTPAAARPVAPAAPVRPAAVAAACAPGAPDVRVTSRQRSGPAR
jgi:membrane protein DedA with SNARE-associated domain